MSDRGQWMQTWGGRKFHPCDPLPSEVFLEDIANALARICRFGGHVTVPHYSVAQHSVLVARHVPERWQRTALLHDAAEAYVGDMIRPLKLTPGLGDAFKAIENQVAWAIGERFSVDLIDMSPLVKRADNIILATERRDIMRPGLAWGGLTEAPSHEKIVFGWDPETAASSFLVAARGAGIE